ncbi:MAG: DUF2520 domain-containing protein [Acidobacteriota bacterium]
MTEPTYGLIGRGRVATHMAHYLRLEEQPCFVWHRDAGLSVERALEHCDTILLAVNDDALGPFAEAHPFLSDRTTVHFSGCRVMASIPGIHPVMTFGPELYALETYRAMPFVEEAGGLTFGEVFPALENPSWSLDPEDKPLYHALCVLGANGTAVLASTVFGQLESRLGLPRTLLAPLMEKTLENALVRGGEALTGGPWVRGDAETIDSNLEALKGNPMAGLYHACLQAHRNGDERR